MALLVHHLKFSWPERSQLPDAGFRTIQVCGVLKPQQFFTLFSNNIVLVLLHDPVLPGWANHALLRAFLSPFSYPRVFVQAPRQAFWPS
jgi:hypothetical protein